MRQLLMNMSGVVVARMPRPVVQPGTVLIRVTTRSSASAPRSRRCGRRARRRRTRRPSNAAWIARASSTTTSAPAFAIRARPLAGCRRSPSVGCRARARRRSRPSARRRRHRLSSDLNAQGWAHRLLGRGRSRRGRRRHHRSRGRRPGRLRRRRPGEPRGLHQRAAQSGLPRARPAATLKHAASATIGAIALQGVRRAAPQLGERVCVIGLGLIGQITVQLLKAAGCHVIGLDLDPARVERALALGLDAGASDADTLQGARARSDRRLRRRPHADDRRDQVARRHQPRDGGHAREGHRRHRRRRRARTSSARCSIARRSIC